MLGLEQSKVEQIFDLYGRAEQLYKNCSKPNNYLPYWVIKRLPFTITLEDLYCIIKGLKEKPLCPICGKVCKFSNFTTGYNKFCSSTCAFKYKPQKGKSYLEIYGTSSPACGFKKGEDNLAKLPEIRKKISISVKKSYDKNNGILRKIRSANSLKLGTLPSYGLKIKDNFGNFYRSALEARLSNLLINNKINFDYEKRIKMINGHNKYVDFVIDNNIFIEVTGYAYAEWINDFNHKMKIFDLTRNKLNSFIYILTYPENIDLIKTYLIQGYNPLENKDVLFYNGQVIKEIFYSSEESIKTFKECGNRYKLSNVNIIINSIDNDDAILEDIRYMRNILKFSKGFNEF